MFKIRRKIKLIFRSIKCSYKDLVTFPAWELLSQYWKDEILVEFKYLWKGEPRELCGVVMDPAKFIPKYLERFLERRRMEGDLPPPGNYEIKIKASLNTKPWLQSNGWPVVLVSDIIR